MWNAFGGGAIAACPNNVPVGKVDTIKLRVLPGTPPGDYTFGWDFPAVTAAANAPAICSATPTTGMSATIRVLPPR